MKHLNIREMAVKDCRQQGLISVSHIAGTVNPSDLLTKEHKDDAHFLTLVHLVLSPRLRGGC